MQNLLLLLSHTDCSELFQNESCLASSNAQYYTLIYTVVSTYLEVFHCFLRLFWCYHDDALDTSRINSGSFIVYSQTHSFRNPKLRMLAIDLNQVFSIENFVFVQNSSQRFD